MNNNNYVSSTSKYICKVRWWIQHTKLSYGNLLCCLNVCTLVGVTHASAYTECFVGKKQMLDSIMTKATNRGKKCPDFTFSILRNGKKERTKTIWLVYRSRFWCWIYYSTRISCLFILFSWILYIHANTNGHTCIKLPVKEEWRQHTSQGHICMFAPEWRQSVCRSVSLSFVYY